MKNKTEQPSIVFQGDICFVQIPAVPESATSQNPEGGRHIVAHSETGHHHYVDALHAKAFNDPKDPNVCYLQMLSDADVIHDRPWDTHAPVKLKGGQCYKGIRQVERTPAGWARVQD